MVFVLRVTHPNKSYGYFCFLADYLPEKFEISTKNEAYRFNDGAYIKDVLNTITLAGYSYEKVYI